MFAALIFLSFAITALTYFCNARSADLPFDADFVVLAADASPCCAKAINGAHATNAKVANHAALFIFLTPPIRSLNSMLL